MLKNTVSSYGLISKLFHWLIGIAIIGLLVIGFTMVSILPSTDKWQLYAMHKATGVVVLFFVLLRFLWRFINIKLELPADLPLWQKLASKITHYLLYIFMFLMPVSGILMSRFGGHEINVFNLFIIPPLEKNIILARFFNNLHEVSAFLFAALIGLHISAGLYHHFIRKDNILSRMIK
ncbi:MAG: cytochrome b [Rickettsiaceae bacterium]|mgnify:FL=1|jgi:cytochrome b561|nr:cytochrome b [Rickettsiaceae bacterium]